MMGREIESSRSNEMLGESIDLRWNAARWNYRDVPRSIAIVVLDVEKKREREPVFE